MHAGKCSLALSPVHDALQDGGEWRDANASPDQDGVLRGEDLPGGRPVRPVYVALSNEGGVVFRGQRSADTETSQKKRFFSLTIYVLQLVSVFLFALFVLFHVSLVLTAPPWLHVIPAFAKFVQIIMVQK